MKATQRTTNESKSGDCLAFVATGLQETLIEQRTHFEVVLNLPFSNKHRNAHEATGESMGQSRESKLGTLLYRSVNQPR